MSDIYYTNDFDTESNERGDVRRIYGDDQLAQQLITVAGNTILSSFNGGTVTEGDAAEFAGDIEAQLRRVDNIGDVRSIDVSLPTHEDNRLDISIKTTLADASTTFSIS